MCAGGQIHPGILGRGTESKQQEPRRADPGWGCPPAEGSRERLGAAVQARGLLGQGWLPALRPGGLPSPACGLGALPGGAGSQEPPPSRSQPPSLKNSGMQPLAAYC